MYPFEKMHFLTWIDLNSGFWRNWDTFLKKSTNGTFKALQIKLFGPKKFYAVNQKFQIRNCQFFTFDSLHSTWNFLGQHTFIWSLLNVPLINFFKNLLQILPNLGLTIGLNRIYLQSNIGNRIPPESSTSDHLKENFWMYFAQPSFCIFKWCVHII